MSSPHPLKVMIAGLFSLVLTIGVARFSYTPLLPVMMDGTFLSDASGGWLATINYMGYMLGAFIAASISDLQLKDKLYRIGLVVAVLSTIGMALADNYILWATMRFFAGLSSAAGLLIGSGLILNWMLRQGHRAELGVHFGGLGLGIALSAAVAMLMSGKLDWAQQWQVFTVVGIALAIPAWLWLPKPDSSPVTKSGEKLVDNEPEKSWMWILFAAYFCAGFGYVITATFLVAIVDNQPALNGNGSLVWLLTGLAAAPACIFWDRVARKVGELKALFIAYGVNIVGIIIPVLDNSLTGVIISGILFGATFIGIVSLMLTMVGKFFPTKPAKPMGKLTLSYGVAQIVAPAMSGMMAEASGNYNMPLVMAAIIMAAGMGLIVVLQIRKQH
ncbi:MAG: Transporter, MFS superfamily [uncultured Thiotrichaceae bacterium]|uniref:Transporter, MFS superfamily n=1 Tax=uncultured Thiotrichaceae bacterium TaxID=298394 RepID=A0A6S6TQ78_9GAMM|nr:MAG: Transporter, MFS superfamily [uncultured Thiotrichaceae bacterium]